MHLKQHIKESFKKKARYFPLMEKFGKKKTFNSLVLNMWAWFEKVLYFSYYG
jgi:hypothetical protein